MENVTIDQVLDIIALGQYTEAIPLLNYIILHNPSSQAYFYNGLCLYRNNIPEEALTCFEMAHQLNPVDSKALAYKGMCLQSLGQIHEAIKFLKMSLELKKEVNVYISLSQSLFDIKSFEEAILALKEAIKLSPNNFTALNNLGYTLQEIGQHEEAIVQFKKSISLSSIDKATSFVNIAYSFHHTKRYEDAIKYCDFAIEEKPTYSNAYRNKAASLIKLGRYEEAIANTDKALELDPQYSEAFSTKAKAYKKIEYYDVALALYKRAIELNISLEAPLAPKIDKVKSLIQLQYIENSKNIMDNVCGAAPPSL